MIKRKAAKAHSNNCLSSKLQGWFASQQKRARSAKPSEAETNMQFRRWCFQDVWPCITLYADISSTVSNILHSIFTIWCVCVSVCVCVCNCRCVCLQMCVCVLVCLCVCACVRVRVRMCMCAHVRVCACMHMLKDRRASDEYRIHLPGAWSLIPSLSD